MKNAKCIVSGLFLIITISVIIYSCSAPRYLVGRKGLYTSEHEAENYGLYSYLLFAEKPSNDTYKRYLSIVESCLNKIVEIDEIETYYNISRDSLNIFYFPLKNKFLYKYEDNTKKAKWIIENYDYTRATIYLNKCNENLTKGPYIISNKKPLYNTRQVDDKYLIQDFSYVHERVVSLWVDEFILQSSGACFWDNEELNTFSNNLRNYIAISADALAINAEVLTWWKDSLNEWIKLE